MCVTAKRKESRRANGRTRKEQPRFPLCGHVTMSHLLKGQLFGPNRDQKLFKNSKMVKNCSKTVKIENVTVSHLLKGQLFGPKRADVTMSHLLKGQLFGPKHMSKTRVTACFLAFFQIAWRDRANGLIYSGKKKMAGWMLGRSVTCRRRMGPCGYYGRPAGQPGSQWPVPENPKK